MDRSVPTSRIPGQGLADKSYDIRRPRSRISIYRDPQIRTGREKTSSIEPVVSASRAPVLKTRASSLGASRLFQVDIDIDFGTDRSAQRLVDNGNGWFEIGADPLALCFTNKLNSRTLSAD